MPPPRTIIGTIGALQTMQSAAPESSPWQWGRRS